MLFIDSLFFYSLLEGKPGEINRFFGSREKYNPKYNL